VKANRRRIIFAVIFAFALILPLFILADRSVQRKMIYYPSRYIPSQAQLSANDMQFWPDDVNNYRGFVIAPNAERIKGTIIIFHGNAGAASNRTYYLKSLTQLGFRVILAEYPGYGGRTGEPGEEVFVDDAKETLRLAAAQYGQPIFLLGESLGCGVVAAVVKDAPVKADGIILITPWDTLLSVAKEKVPWLPVKWLLHDRYDSIQNLKNYTGRIAIIGAEMDELIPVRHAQNLYESLQGSGDIHRMLIIKNARHNDWPDMVDQAWWKEVMDVMRPER
jgi:uncharacterized protein